MQFLLTFLDFQAKSQYDHVRRESQEANLTTHRVSFRVVVNFINFMLIELPHNWIINEKLIAVLYVFVSKFFRIQLANLQSHKRIITAR